MALTARVSPPTNGLGVQAILFVAFVAFCRGLTAVFRIMGPTVTSGETAKIGAVLTGWENKLCLELEWNYSRPESRSL